LSTSAVRSVDELCGEVAGDESGESTSGSLSSTMLKLSGMAALERAYVELL
jgi:hypothetical protein